MVHTSKYDGFEYIVETVNNITRVIDITHEETTEIGKYYGEYDADITETVIKKFDYVNAEPQEYTVNFFADVDVHIKAKSFEEAREIAKKKLQGEHRDEMFPYVYLNEIKFVTDENGNEQ